LLPSQLLSQISRLGPRGAAHLLVHSLRRAHLASYVAVYDLDLASGAFRPWVDTSSEGDFESLASRDEFRVPKQLSQHESQSTNPLVTTVSRRELITTATSTIYPGQSIGTSILYPVTRERVVTAIVRVDWEVPPIGIRATIESDLALCSVLLDHTLERRFVMRIFDSLPQATNIHTSEREYLDQLLLLTLESAQMQFLALRELNDSQTELTTLALWGFGGRPREEFDLRRSDPRAAPFFWAVDESKPLAIAAVDESQFPDIRSMAPEVESFVVAPVRVAGRHFGTLSFATSTEYEYSEMERLAFDTIANAIGTGISNYRNFHTAAENIADLRELSKAVTAVELAQAARHEARVLLDTCQTELSNAQLFIGKGKGGDALGAISRASDGFAEIESALDKIREAQMAPVRDASLEEEASMRELFLAARSYALGKLNIERISCDYVGPEVRARVSKAWMRNVFANLILNSIDAYTAGGSPKRRRWITLRAEAPDMKSRMFRLSYQDEAGGINPSALSRPRKRHDEMPITQLIFERDVTSKANGTGYGLFIARRVIHDLGGSLELTQYRRGVTFDILLPIGRLVN
jgi:signal transduction histidine kinase